MEIVDYGPLWETMRRNNVTQYQLLQSGIDNHTLDSLKKGGNITMLTLEKLCKIIGCTPNDVVSFKNRDRFIQLGIAIAALRKMRGLSQEKLAEKAGVSRSLISTIEAPNMAHGFSLDVFFDIADALEVDPADLINASVFPDRIIKSK